MQKRLSLQELALGFDHPETKEDMNSDHFMKTKHVRG